METKEYTHLDRTQWPSGLWDSEPDKIQFEDPATKFPCLIVRNPHLGNLCGYVGVPEGHPAFGKDWEEVYEVSVHGGLTYANFCVEDDKERGICHVPGPGDPDRVWWLGFDCGHAFDAIPLYARRLPDIGTYKTIEYVKAECAELALQLEAIK